MTTLIVLAVAVAVLVAVTAVLLYRRRRSRRAVGDAGRDAGTEATLSVADRVVERVAEQAAAAPAEDTETPPVTQHPPTLRDRLGKARTALAHSLGSVLDRSSLNDDAWGEVTEALIRADVGLETSTQIVAAARQRITSDAEPAQVTEALRAELREQLGGQERSLARRDDGGVPSVWMFVGVNGTGKTTTIGKLAKREADNGARVVLAAGDTFRAAAADQLEMWADRAGSHIVRGAQGADPASVVYDAIESASARSADLVLADTAGRLHTEQNLMAELSKVRRVADKGAGVVTETLLVLDATSGQNGLAQVRQFAEAVDISGVILTKLDGSAKGGIVIAVQTELGVPVKLVGVGEGIADLVAFDETEFVDALLG